MMKARLTYALAATVMAVGLAAPEARGSQGPSVSKTENIRTESSGTDQNPCTGEQFNYQGKLHLQQQTGPNQWRFSVHEQAVGVTLVGGVRYETQLWSDTSEQGTTPPLFTRFTARRHIIRTDPGKASSEQRDDFFVTMRCTNGDCQTAPADSCR